VTLNGWGNVRQDLKKIHEQVEVAMEWEELWAKVLGDVGAEMDSLSQLVFEMEEKRHLAYQTQTQAGPSENIDLNELESFIDEPSEKRAAPNARFSLPPFETSPLGSPVIQNPTDDSNLLALFARMQPLRASLDFLPMRLSMFQSRAEKIFPSACRELDDKRERLERNWTELSKEADNLRRELSEDRWVRVFRNAGRQAQKMCDSVERSIVRVQEAIHENYQSLNPLALGKRIESFEAKKMHYGPAINRVLAIIQKGLKDRLTVNGEILRLHKDLSSRMRDLTDTMEDLETLLEPFNARQNSQLRESISSIVSADRSFTSTTFAGTPGSSPPSSIDLPPRPERSTPKYGLNGYTKQRTPSTSRPPPPTSGNRRSSMVPQTRRPTTPMSHASSGGLRRGVSPMPGPPSVYRQGVYSPPVAQASPRPGPTPVVKKPRWSAVVKSHDATLAPTYRSSSTATPVTARKYSPRSISSSTALPLRSPLSREASASPSSMLPTLARRDSQQFKSFAERVADPLPARTSSLMDPVPYHRTRNASAPITGTIRSPSSLAVHSQNKPTMSGMTVPRPPSALSRSYGPSPGLPLRSITHGARLENGSTGDAQYGMEEADRLSENEEEDQITEPGSSPLSRRTITRPSSVLAMNGKAKRMSLLPVPVGSGRQSSLGSRIS
jgi:hypothetical protein